MLIQLIVDSACDQTGIIADEHGWSHALCIHQMLSKGLDWGCLFTHLSVFLSRIFSPAPRSSQIIVAAVLAIAKVNGGRPI